MRVCKSKRVDLCASSIVIQEYARVKHRLNFEYKTYKIKSIYLLMLK